MFWFRFTGTGVVVVVGFAVVVVVVVVATVVEPELAGSCATANMPFVHAITAAASKNFCSIKKKKKNKTGTGVK